MRLFFNLKYSEPESVILEIVIFCFFFCCYYNIIMCYFKGGAIGAIGAMAAPLFGPPWKQKVISSTLDTYVPQTASFPGSCAGEEEKEPGTHCSHMRQVPLVTCILLYSATLKLRSISAYMLKAALHSYTPCGTHTSNFGVKNNITLTVTVCIATFEVIGELQRGKIASVTFIWNGWTRGQFLQAMSRVPSLLPHHRTHSVVSGRQLLYERSQCPRWG